MPGGSRRVEVAEHRAGGAAARAGPVAPGGWGGGRVCSGASQTQPCRSSTAHGTPGRRGAGRAGVRATGCPRSGPRRRTATRVAALQRRRRPSRPAAPAGAGSGGEGATSPPAAAGRRRRPAAAPTGTARPHLGGAGHRVPAGRGRATPCPIAAPGFRALRRGERCATRRQADRRFRYRPLTGGNPTVTTVTADWRSP